MSIYRGLQIRMWGDAKFRALSHPQPNAQTLWVHLLSGPRTTILPGVILAGLGTLADDLRWMDGWSSDAIGECLREIEAAGMARTDLDAGVIWLPRAIDANPPKSQDNVASRTWRDAWEMIPECPLKNEIHAGYHAHMERRGAEFEAAWSDITSHHPMGDSIGPTIGRPESDGVGGEAGAVQDSNRTGSGTGQDVRPRKREPSPAPKSVVEHVREKTGRPWRSPHSHLTARLKAGATPEECILVAECKHDEWGGDEKMDQYVRQKTLYAPGNFDDYLTQALRWDEGGRKPQRKGAKPVPGSSDDPFAEYRGSGQ